MGDLTDFEREGFFKVDSLNVPEYVEENFAPFLEVFYRLNKLAWSLQYEMKLPKPENDIRRAWCTVLYARTLNFVQAAVMLATKGMRVQADTQHRCALETLFKLGALTNDEQFIIEYDLAERKDHIRQGRAFVTYLNRRKPKDKALIKQIEASCKAKESDLIERLKAHRPELFEGRSEKEALKKSSVTTEQYARIAERLDMYDLHYRMGSASVHSDAKSLEDGHFELNEDGTVKKFKNEPHLEDLDMVIHTLCYIVLDAVEFVGKALEYDVPEAELRIIAEALEACHKNAGSVPK
ncbi:MAG: hypothetical protein HWE10_09870 [Gammaproteobacteria bacterium]|nr:hypothetical protein [Gammaproteobacteria bacterium]